MLPSGAEWGETKAVTNITISDGRQADGEEVQFLQYHPKSSYDGHLDHNIFLHVGWTSKRVYVCIIVQDEFHSHPNNAQTWAFDGLQIALSNADQDTMLALLNFALKDNGEPSLNKELWPRKLSDPVFGISRSENGAERFTTYEFDIPSSLWGVSRLLRGLRFGLGVVVNDADAGEDYGPRTQMGWSGWAPNSIVFGKDPEETGLVILTAATCPDPPTYGNPNIQISTTEFTSVDGGLVRASCSQGDTLRNTLSCQYDGSWKGHLYCAFRDSGKDYAAFLDEVDWVSAEATCQTIGGHLTSMSSTRERDTIQRMHSTFNVGLHTLCTSHIML